MTRLTRNLAALALALGALVLSACNTIHGVGRDIQATGRAVANFIDETNDGDPRTP